MGGIFSHVVILYEGDSILWFSDVNQVTACFSRTNDECGNRYIYVVYREPQTWLGFVVPPLFLSNSLCVFPSHDLNPSFTQIGKPTNHHSHASQEDRVKKKFGK